MRQTKISAPKRNLGRLTAAWTISMVLTPAWYVIEGIMCAFLQIFLHRTRMPATRVSLRSMPIRLVVMFVALAALDLACQILGGFAERWVPVIAQTAARLGAALLLSVLMIAAYRWLVRTLEKRAADELSSATAARQLVLGIVVGAALFVAVYGVLWALGAVTLQGSGGLSGLGAALAVAEASVIALAVALSGSALLAWFTIRKRAWRRSILALQRG